MGIISLILVAVAVSIDGFWSGFSFGLRKVKISFLSLLNISSWSVVGTMITMVGGKSIQNYISLETGKYIGASLLLILGLYTLREGNKQNKEATLKNVLKQNVLGQLHVKNLIKVVNNPILADIDKENDIKHFEAIILGIAVAMDASVAAFTLSFFDFNPFITPFLFGLTHFALIGLGNVLARKNLIYSFADRFTLLPGLILVTLAILRFI
ncbi:manganese efflux pump [Tepidibacillus fermentans]|uniref:Putative sporulation protein YtaF n=1 Tax=Tepidibacillus fermentans TaxID=1281767 RepID=A0A4R3KIP0_9BACI|nr:manganese efflux pump [Tepidibacillus fermentans]TCS83054.1 putative sporulation protein YtaF [Tepidibacillus fermentans]